MAARPLPESSRSETLDLRDERRSLIPGKGTLNSTTRRKAADDSELVELVAVEVEPPGGSAAGGGSFSTLLTGILRAR
eukprot:scaffold4612_cov68-Phaeocystis_antarctica.AAC.4